MASLRIIGLVLSLLSLSACSSEAVTIHFLPDHSINTTKQHQELPLEIKLYQLSSKQAFTTASFHELWQQDRQTLGKSLLQRKIVIIKPGIKRTIELDKVSHARYLGLVAIYHNKPKARDWRLIIPMPSGLLLIPGAVSIKVKAGSIANL